MSTINRLNLYRALLHNGVFDYLCKPLPLDQLASTLLMPELGSKRFVVEGHTDTTGGASHNLPLSQRRADAVRRVLEEELV